jgi:hypothetical protein
VSGHHHAHHQVEVVRANSFRSLDQLRDALPAPAGGNLFAELHGEVVEEMATITHHQWSHRVRRGLVKGFFLSGAPGTGKTTMAARLALALGDRLGPAHEVALVTVDGREIARARYGESEQRIQDIFQAAESGFSEPNRRIVLLFDDVESVLMARGSMHAKEWHFSQDSTFFHAVDQLDTSRVVLVATTNRPDLVDEAIRDRLLGYDVGPPPPELLIAVVEVLGRTHGLTEGAIAELASTVARGAGDGTLTSLREVERLVLRHYVRSLVGSPGSVGAAARG